MRKRKQERSMFSLKEKEEEQKGRELETPIRHSTSAALPLSLLLETGESHLRQEGRLTVSV